MIFNPRVVQLTGARIALLPPSDLAASAGNTQVSLTWTDPGDETSGGQVVAEWEFTRIVRKAGSAPANQNDGVIVVDSTVKNQYMSEPFVDTGLTNGTTYYYGAFACSDAGAWSDGAFVSATPQDAYILGELTEGTLVKIKENGSPVEFYVACQNYQSDLNGEGRTLMVRKEITQSGVLGAANTQDYANSTLDQYFNNQYSLVFSQSVKSMIGTTSFYYSPNRTSTVVQLERSIFTLSYTEMGGPSSWNNDEGNVLPIASTLANIYSQWTRSVYTSSAYNFWCKYVNQWEHFRADQIQGYRPCFTLPAESLVDFDMNLIEGEAPPVEDTPLSELAEGTLITIKENGTPVEFYVSKQGYEPSLNTSDRVLMVRKDVYDQRQWNSSSANAWASSTIHSWLNSGYKGLFSAYVQSIMGATTYEYTVGNNNNTVATRSDAVFLLSLTELGESYPSYANVEGSALPIANTLKIAYQNGVATTQWTRSPQTQGIGLVWRFDQSGNFTLKSCTESHGSRPCFTLPSTALVDPSNALIES